MEVFDQSLQEIDAKVLKQQVWERMAQHQGEVFRTAKNLEFTYRIKGYEMFVSRRDKSITRSTVDVAVDRVVELDGIVTGPKKLGVFGASYIYPVFLALGVARKKQKPEIFPKNS